MANLRTSRFEFIPLPFLKASQIDTPYAKSENNLQKLNDRTYPRVDEIFQDEEGNLYLHKEIDGVYKYLKINVKSHVGSQNGNYSNNTRTPFECLGYTACNGKAVAFEDGTIGAVIDDNFVILKQNDKTRTLDVVNTIEINSQLVEDFKHVIGGFLLSKEINGKETPIIRISTACNNIANNTVEMKIYDIDPSFNIARPAFRNLLNSQLVADKPSFVNSAYGYKRVYVNTNNGLTVIDAETLLPVDTGANTDLFAYHGYNTVIIEAYTSNNNIVYYQLTNSGEYKACTGPFLTAATADKCLVLNNKWMINNPQSVFYPFILSRDDKYIFYNACDISRISSGYDLDLDIDTTKEVIIQFIDNTNTLNHSNESFGHDKRILSFSVITRNIEHDSTGYVYHVHLYYFVSARYALSGSTFTVPPRLNLVKVGHYILDPHETFSDGWSYDLNKMPILAHDLTILDNGNILVSPADDDANVYLFSNFNCKYLAASFADSLFAAYMEIINGHAEYLEADSLKSSNARIDKGVTIDNYSSDSHGGRDYTLSKVTQSGESFCDISLSRSQTDITKGLDGSVFFNDNILTNNFGTVSYDSEFLIAGAVYTNNDYKYLRLNIYSVTDNRMYFLKSNDIEFGDSTLPTFHILKGYLIFTAVVTDAADCGHVFMAKSVKPLAEYIGNDTIEMESNWGSEYVPNNNNQVEYAGMYKEMHNIYTDNSIIQIFKTFTDDTLFMQEISLEPAHEATIYRNDNTSLYNSTDITDKAYELKQYYLTISITGYNIGQFTLGIYTWGYKYLSSYNSYYGDFVFLVGSKNGYIPTALRVIRPSAYKDSNRIVPNSWVAIPSPPESFNVDSTEVEHVGNLLDAYPIDEHNLVFVRASKSNPMKIMSFYDMFSSTVSIADPDLKEFSKTNGFSYDTNCMYVSTADGLLAIGDIGDEYVVTTGNDAQHRCGSIPKSYFGSNLSNVRAVVLGDYLILYNIQSERCFRIKLSYSGIQAARAAFNQVIAAEVNALKLNAETINNKTINTNEVITNKIELGGAELTAEKGISPSVTFKDEDKSVFSENFKKFIRTYINRSRILSVGDLLGNLSIEKGSMPLNTWAPLLSRPSGLYTIYYVFYRVRTEFRISYDEAGIGLVVDFAFVDGILSSDFDTRLDHNEVLYTSIKISNTTLALNKTAFDNINPETNSASLMNGRRTAGQRLYFRASGFPYMNNANLGINYTKLETTTYGGQSSTDFSDTISLFQPFGLNDSRSIMAYGADVLLTNETDTNNGKYTVYVRSVMASDTPDSQCNFLLKTTKDTINDIYKYLKIHVDISNNTVQCINTEDYADELFDKIYVLSANNDALLNDLPDSSKYGTAIFNDGEIRKLPLSSENDIKIIPALLKNSGSKLAYASGIFAVNCNDTATDITFDKVKFMPLRYLYSGDASTFTDEELYKGFPDSARCATYGNIGQEIANAREANQELYGNNKYYTQDILLECTPKILAIDVSYTQGYTKVTIAATSYGDGIHADTDGLNANLGVFLKDNSNRWRYSFHRSGVTTVNTGDTSAYTDDEMCRINYYNTYITGFTAIGDTMKAAISGETLTPYFIAGYVQASNAIYDYLIPDDKMIDAKFACNGNYFLFKPALPSIGKENHTYGTTLSILKYFNSHYIAPTYMTQIEFVTSNDTLRVFTREVLQLGCDNRGITGTAASFGKELDYYNDYKNNVATTSLTLRIMSYSSSLGYVKSPENNNKYTGFNYDTVRQGTNYVLFSTMTQSELSDSGNKVYYPSPSDIGICPIPGTSVIKDAVLLVTYVPMTRLGDSRYVPYGILAFIDATDSSNKKLRAIGGITNEDLESATSLSNKLQRISGSSANEITYDQHYTMFNGLRKYLLDKQIYGNAYGTINNYVRAVPLTQINSSDVPRKLGYTPYVFSDPYNGYAPIFRGVPPVVKFADTYDTSKLINEEITESNRDSAHRFIKLYPLITGTINSPTSYNIKLSVVIDACLGYTSTNDDVEYAENEYFENTSVYYWIDCFYRGNPVYKRFWYLNENIVALSKSNAYTFNLNNNRLNKNAVEIPDTGAADNNNITVYPARAESSQTGGVSGALIVKEEISDDTTNNDVLVEGNYVIKTTAPIQVIHL